MLVRRWIKVLAFAAISMVALFGAIYALSMYYLFPNKIGSQRELYEIAYSHLKLRYNMPFDSFDALTGHSTRCCSTYRDNSYCCWPLNGETWQVNFVIKWPSRKPEKDSEYYFVYMNTAGIVFDSGADIPDDLRSARYRRMPSN